MKSISKSFNMNTIAIQKQKSMLSSQIILRSNTSTTKDQLKKLLFKTLKKNPITLEFISVIEKVFNNEKKKEILHPFYLFLTNLFTIIKKDKYKKSKRLKSIKMNS